MLCQFNLSYIILWIQILMKNDFFSSLSEFIFCESRPEKSNIIIVPGCADITPLAREAARLYHEWYGKKILFSGAKNTFFHHSCPTEAECLKDIAVWLGVPSEDIILETRARHTFENALYTFRKLKKLNYPINSAILVCKWFHSRRALLSYQSVFGPKVHFTLCAIPGSRDITPDNWLHDEEKRNIVLSEIEKIGNYLKKHMIQIEQNLDLSIFQKHAKFILMAQERILQKNNSSDYFVTKRKICQKIIPKTYRKIILFSLDDIFSPWFFRDFLKQIIPENAVGEIHSTAILKSLTSSLEGSDFRSLIKLWEAYVRAVAPDVFDTVKLLKTEATYCILVWYEYDQFLQIVCNILGIHRSYGTSLEYVRDVCTWEVSVPASFFATDGAISPFHNAHTLLHHLNDEDIYLLDAGKTFSPENHSYQRIKLLSSITRVG